MGNKLKKIIINVCCSLLIVISFVLVTNSFFSNKLESYIFFGISVIILILSYLLLSKRPTHKLSIKIIKVCFFSITLLFSFIYIDSTFNDYDIINYFLDLKSQKNYEGETRSRALTSLFFSNIYPIILGIVFFLIFILSRTKDSVKS